VRATFPYATSLVELRSGSKSAGSFLGCFQQSCVFSPPLFPIAAFSAPADRLMNSTVKSQSSHILAIRCRGLLLIPQQELSPRPATSLPPSVPREVFFPGPPPPLMVILLKSPPHPKQNYRRCEVRVLYKDVDTYFPPPPAQKNKAVFYYAPRRLHSNRFVYRRSASFPFLRNWSPLFSI